MECVGKRWSIKHFTKDKTSGCTMYARLCTFPAPPTLSLVLTLLSSHRYWVSSCIRCVGVDGGWRPRWCDVM